ncbi:hypothetical protein [Streptomyces sp. NPDC053427]|uniref:hypothetical protein n=1 Tax=Streptomyces sp. NPDC053427 TaxID=3365701 RepID=UPI0037D0E364
MSTLQPVAAPGAGTEIADVTANRKPDAEYGPYAGYEECWIAGNEGQQAGQWRSFFCAQNGTPSWWLFTTP